MLADECLGGGLLQRGASGAAPRSRRAAGARTMRAAATTAYLLLLSPRCVVGALRLCRVAAPAHRPSARGSSSLDRSRLRRSAASSRTAPARAATRAASSTLASRAAATAATAASTTAASIATRRCVRAPRARRRALALFFRACACVRGAGRCERARCVPLTPTAIARAAAVRQRPRALRRAPLRRRRRRPAQRRADSRRGRRRHRGVWRLRGAFRALSDRGGHARVKADAAAGRGAGTHESRREPSWRRGGDGGCGRGDGGYKGMAGVGRETMGGDWCRTEGRRASEEGAVVGGDASSRDVVSREDAD